MSNNTLGKRTNIPIYILNHNGKYTPKSAWWLTCTPCKECRKLGKRVYMVTDGTTRKCARCEDRELI